MFYALSFKEDGSINSRLVYSEAQDGLPPGQYPCTEEQYANHTAYRLDGGTIASLDPAQVLGQLKAAHIQDLYAKGYAIDVYADISFEPVGGGVHVFQADADSVSKLASTILAFGNSAQTPVGFYWLSKENNRVPVTYADLREFAGAIGVRGLHLFQKMQDLKLQVLTALTADEVSSITWN